MDNLKRAGITIIILLIGISLFVWYLIVNPPLYISGWGTTFYPDNRELQGIVVNIHNKGFTALRLEKVYINENEVPEVVELGISKTFSLVQRFTPSEDEKNGISFHKLDEFEIRVDLTPRQKQDLSNDKDVIKHYGVWFQTSGKPVDKVTIKYRYLGIPFTLNKSLKV